MKATLQDGEEAVTLEFEAVADVEMWFGEVKEQTGFYLQLDRELKQEQNKQVKRSALRVYLKRTGQRGD